MRQSLAVVLLFSQLLTFGAAQVSGWSNCPGFDSSKIRIQSILEVSPLMARALINLRVGIVPVVGVSHSGIILRMVSTKDMECEYATGTLTFQTSLAYCDRITPIGSLHWYEMKGSKSDLICAGPYTVSISILSNGKPIACLNTVKTISAEKFN